MKAIGTFLLRNWRWILPLLTIIVWFFLPNKHWLSFAAGIAFTSFIWYAVAHKIIDASTL